MPNDVEAHRERIAAAVWRLVASRGLDAVSLRSVAAEADVSMGQVQHYFAAKNDLLYAGVAHSYRLIEQRLQREPAGSPGSPRDLMLALLTLLLGEDKEMRDAIRVNIAFGTRAQNEERIQELLTSGDEEIVALCAQVIAAAQSAGHVGRDLDPVEEARVLFAITTGLGTQVAVYLGPPARARATFDYYIQRLGLTR